MWEQFYNNIIFKGINAVKLTWVKGHAKQVHIDKGLSDEVKKAGNDKADLVADIGARLHGKDIIQIASCLQTRHVKYSSFMRDVGTHIVEAYLIHRQLVDRKGVVHKKIEQDTD